jgi:2,3-bisphosphoglycerate-dependent phosphoglycerate mutase
MTHIYFVRHAQPDSSIKIDRIRPLTEKGMRDTKKVTAHLKDKGLHVLMSSPYKRSMDTIRDLANTLHMEILTDEDFREREIGSGYNGDPDRYIENMWEDFEFKAEGAECLQEVQLRNISALKKVLAAHCDENIVIATHGTALSSILNYYDPSFRLKDFLRILEFWPYIIRLDFDGDIYLGRMEELIVE